MSEERSAEGNGATENQSSGGLLSRILALFSGGGDPEREKKRRLKEIAKDLQRQKYKFYKPKSGEALPALGRFLFELYKVVGPAQSLLAGADESSALRTIIIESRQTERQAEVRQLFSDEAIREQSKKVDTKQLVAQIKDAMATYFGGFDATVVKEINATYNLLQQLLTFVKFDYYFALRKFDSRVQEGNFTTTPRFDAINAEYITDDLKDFLEVAIPLPKDANWEPVFDVLVEYKGVEVIDRAAWKKALTGVHNVVRSGILPKIIQHVEKDPQYAAEVQVKNEHIVENYLNLMKTKVEASIQKLIKEQKTNKKNQLLQAIFGTSAVQRSKNYTEAMNATFTKKRIAGFLHVEAVNYLKAFLIDYFKGEIRQVVSDILIVRGEWTDQITSNKLSDSFYAVMSIAQQVTEFDESLGEEGELGMKLRKATSRVVERDPSSAQPLRQLLKEINEQAGEMIRESASNLIEMGKVLKLLVEDVSKDRPEVIINWKDLEGYLEEPLKDLLVKNYKRTYFFVQLMQMLVKS